MLNFGIKLDKTLNSLRADVKSVVETSFSLSDGKKKFRDKSNYYYNENGTIIMVEYYDEEGKLELKQKSRFDGEIKTGFINYDEFENIIGTGIFEFSNNGQIIAKYKNYECSCRYEYDTNGNIAAVFYPNTGEMDIFEYDENNLVVNQISVPKEQDSELDSIFKEIFNDDNGKQITTYKNDKFGNIIEMCLYEFDSVSNDWKTKFSQTNLISDFGDEYKSVLIRNNGDITTISSEYEYDYKGNWVFRKTINKDICNETYREISYYSE